jgi:hypothetical protein
MKASLKNILEIIRETYVKDHVMSENLRYHASRGVGVDKNILRPGSDGFFSLFREARKLSVAGLYEANEIERYYLFETDIGEFDYFEGGLVPLDYPMNESTIIEAEYQGKKVKLGKPSRNSGSSGGQFKVFVKNKKTGKVKKVTFGSREMRSRLSDPAARKSFAARHKCKQTKDRTSARYWSCRLGRYPHLTGSKKKYTWW